MQENIFTVTLLIPVLNEVEGLKRILPTIDMSLFDDVVVVDGHSQDGSVEYARSQGVRVVYQKRKGLSLAVYDAIVDEVSTQFVIEFSPDGNCPVELLKPLVDRLRAGYDLVVVSRYLESAKSEDDTLVTAFGNRMFSLMIHWLGKAKITDSLNIYRGFRCSIVGEEFLQFLYGPVFEPLVSALANLRNLKVDEISGYEPKRICGASKMSIWYNGSCILLMVIRMYFKKFFG